MPDRKSWPAVERQIGMLFGVGAVGGMSDAQLLGRFASGRGPEAEWAFSALVERHGPMVRQVCGAVLVDAHEAQDAFQATFLVLARRARSIRRADSIGPWLFGVARRVASRARVASARRREVEGRGAELAARRRDDARPAESWAELHEEIDRLPNRYRGPIVLCYLEGLSHEQAALRLGCPLPTLRTRLARARARLRDRLARRGLAPTAGLVAASMSTGAAPGLAPMTPSLVEATARLAVAVRSASLPVSAVAALAEPVLRSLIMSQIRIAVVGLVALIAAGAGAGALAVARQEAAAQEARAAAQEAAARLDGALEKRLAAQASRQVGAEADGEGGEPAEVKSQVQVKSEVEGLTTIMSILPEGTKVQKGDLVCELDDANLRDQLTNQQIATERAKAAFENAQETFEFTEINTQEYSDGVFPAELRGLDGEIKLAEAELQLEKERLAAVEALGGDNRLGKLEAERNVLKAELALEKAMTRREVLTNYTKPRQFKALEGEVLKAQTDMVAKQWSMSLEIDKEEKLRRMIEACRIHAPADGVVSYGRPVMDHEAIEVGAHVRERQVIFSIVPAPES